MMPCMSAMFSGSCLPAVVDSCGRSCSVLDSKTKTELASFTSFHNVISPVYVWNLIKKEFKNHFHQFRPWLLATILELSKVLPCQPLHFGFIKDFFCCVCCWALRLVVELLSSTLMTVSSLVLPFFSSSMWFLVIIVGWDKVSHVWVLAPQEVPVLCC
jgi:hypothetical protein